MNCKNCGTTNSDVAKFCVHCGAILNSEGKIENINDIFSKTENINDNNNPIESSSVQLNNRVDNNNPIESPSVQLNNRVDNNDKIKDDFNRNNNLLSYFKTIINFILKPYETFKDKETNLGTIKSSIIFSCIISGVMMLISLVTAMTSTMFVKTFDYSTFEYTTKFELSGLKNLDYLSLVGKNFVIYIAIIFVIAIVYYLATLVIKKQIDFSKIVLISSSSIIPYVIMGMIISPILGKIWAPLSMVSTIIGLVYSIIIFVTLISDSIKFDNKDFMIYFHLVCMTILGTSGYYAYMKLFTSGVTEQISDYLEMFK